MARDDQTESGGRSTDDAPNDQATARDLDVPSPEPASEHIPDPVSLEDPAGDEPDDPNDPELAPPSSPTLARVPPVDRARGRVGSRLSGRPFAVYGVLAAGGLVLLTLLLIIWFSSDGDERSDGPICTDSTADEAIALVKDGAVGQLSIAYPPADESEIDGELELPALLRLNLTDGNCRNLIPQGPSGEIDMYAVFGAAEWYNGRTGQRRIDLDVAANDNIPDSILATSTPIPTPTVPVTETPDTPATPIVAVPTIEPTPAPTPTPTEQPASPEASPAASPAT